jgi:hypothetical protein
MIYWRPVFWRLASTFLDRDPTVVLASPATMLIRPFRMGDKVMLAEMSLLGPFWLGHETLFFRRCHAKASTSAASDAYRAE